MCEAMSLAAFALAATSTAYSYDQQKKTAEYQNELNDYNNKLSQQNLADNLNALAYNQNQERDAATEQLWKDDLEARRAEARARVAAAESGIEGQTIDSIMREIKGQQAAYAGTINQNLQRSYGESEAQRRGLWNTYLSEVGNRAPGQMPSRAAAALQIGQAGLNAYNSYKERQFRKAQVEQKAGGGSAST